MSEQPRIAVFSPILIGPYMPRRPRPFLTPFGMLATIAVCAGAVLGFVL